MASIKVKGLDKLQKSLKENATMDGVKRAVRHNGAEMQKKVQNNADFTKGYQTGNTKRTIGLEITDNGLVAEVGPITEYSPYLEWGTRYMDAQPFVEPAYDEQKKKFKSDMKKLVR